MDLNGKIALITGAGGKRGIGRATALQFACCGADVALTDVHREPEDLPSDEVESGWRGIESVAEEVEKEGRRALAITCDMTRRE